MLNVYTQYKYINEWFFYVIFNPHFEHILYDYVQLQK